MKPWTQAIPPVIVTSLFFSFFLSYWCFPIFHMTDPWELGDVDNCFETNNLIVSCLLMGLLWILWKPVQMSAVCVQFLASSLIIPLLGSWRHTWCITLTGASCATEREALVEAIDHWLLCLQGIQLPPILGHLWWLFNDYGLLGSYRLYWLLMWICGHHHKGPGLDPALI